MKLLYSQFCQGLCILIPWFRVVVQHVCVELVR